MFGKTRYFTPSECVYVGNKELQFVLLPNDIRRPNGRESRKLMEIVNNGKEETTQTTLLYRRNDSQRDIKHLT